MGEEKATSTAGELKTTTGSRGWHTGISAAALLRAFDALSFVDGPCSLSCRDVLTEVGEQAQDLATEACMPLPRISVHGHPCNNTAADIRWPIAPQTRNRAPVGTVPLSAR